jgi:hypothetical protein
LDTARLEEILLVPFVNCNESVAVLNKADASSQLRMLETHHDSTAR